MRNVHLAAMLLIGASVCRAEQGSSSCGSCTDFPAGPIRVLESFEEGVPSYVQASGVPLTVNSRRMKHGNQSLSWQWNGNDTLTFRTLIGYRRQRLLTELQKDHQENLHAAPDIDVYEAPRGFFMWIYNDVPRKQRLRFKFGHGVEVDCWFDYNLDFNGWRTVAIYYDRGDMAGTAREDMDFMTICAPSIGTGTFLIDTLGFSVPMNPRTATPNPQLPQIDRHPRLVSNYEHRMYQFSQYTPLYDPTPLTSQTIEDFRTLDRQAKELYLPDKSRRQWKDCRLDLIEERFRQFEIVREGEEIYGRPLVKDNIMFEYFQELGLSKDRHMEGLMSWEKNFGPTLLQIAEAWNCSDSSDVRDRLAAMFIDLFDYGIDQGFAVGAGLNWIHHYSYEIRDYAPAMFLMRDVLKEHERLQEAIDICKWFHGFNQVYRDDLVYGYEGRIASDADDMQGLLTQRLLCALIMNDSPEKARDLRHFSDHFSTVSTGYANALDEAFKPDGTVFHHAGHTLGYGGRAIYGAVRTWSILKHTQYAASPEAVQRLKKVANTYEFCLFGKNRKTPKAFASIRFQPYTHPKHFGNMPEALGEASASSGMRMLPYSCVGIKRQKNDWMITARTHSKYVYPFESWSRNYFAFPLFIANGYLDVSYPGSLDSTTPSDSVWFDGYDWRRWPGTTTVHLPEDIIATRVGQVRDEGGEYLFSDQPFCGGLETSYGCGVQVFSFKGHDKYELASFTGKKTWFYDGNKVVCLGSDIKSGIENYPVETTLFQDHLETETTPVLINGTECCAPLFEKTLNPKTWLMDTRRTGYAVLGMDEQSSLKLRRGLQENPNCTNTGMATGRFVTVWFDHSIQPVGASYAYVLVAATVPEEMQELADGLNGSVSPIRIVQQNADAHIVRLTEKRATAYAVYKKDGMDFETGLARHVDSASCFMIRQEEDRLRVSLSDPDLNIYDGQDDLLPDGTRGELSIYEHEWFYWPSRESKVHLTLNGRWKMDSLVRAMETTEQQAKVIAANEKSTMVEFTCRDGLSTELILSRVPEQ
ncbi:chondroitinase family polysaccharide lyase [Tichowtungia aerotolerans]|uniref:Uncharacterized protein n=1 Tax=Tichowtungia aerotolerans TaxID=2697043 RepID=A0A6P1M5Q4_9BACT|nr:chondroitinase family polysaccharide lyase [Tichowtungia aerotolerans]QHI70119.1 hypothetical protein GT409_11920 [Tichowtungia aerotolerans]